MDGAGSQKETISTKFQALRHSSHVTMSCQKFTR
jgi:hypothetical protein